MCALPEKIMFLLFNMPTTLAPAKDGYFRLNHTGPETFPDLKNAIKYAENRAIQKMTANKKYYTSSKPDQINAILGGNTGSRVFKKLTYTKYPYIKEWKEKHVHKFEIEGNTTPFSASTHIPLRVSDKPPFDRPRLNRVLAVGKVEKMDGHNPDANLQISTSYKGIMADQILKYKDDISKKHEIASWYILQVYGPNGILSQLDARFDERKHVMTIISKQFGDSIRLKSCDYKERQIVAQFIRTCKEALDFIKESDSSASKLRKYIESSFGVFSVTKNTEFVDEEYSFLHGNDFEVCRPIHKSRKYNGANIPNSNFNKETIRTPSLVVAGLINVANGNAALSNDLKRAERILMGTSFPSPLQGGDLKSNVGDEFDDKFLKSLVKELMHMEDQKILYSTLFETSESYALLFDVMENEDKGTYRLVSSRGRNISQNPSNVRNEDVVGEWHRWHRDLIKTYYNVNKDNQKIRELLNKEDLPFVKIGDVNILNIKSNFNVIKCKNKSFEIEKRTSKEDRNFVRRLEYRKGKLKYPHLYFLFMINAYHQNKNDNVALAFQNYPLHFFDPRTAHVHLNQPQQNKDPYIVALKECDKQKVSFLKSLIKLCYHPKQSSIRNALFVKYSSRGDLITMSKVIPSLIIPVEKDVIASLFMFLDVTAEVTKKARDIILDKKKSRDEIKQLLNGIEITKIIHHTTGRERTMRQVASLASSAQKAAQKGAQKAAQKWRNIAQTRSRTLPTFTRVRNNSNNKNSNHNTQARPKSRSKPTTARVYPSFQNPTLQHRLLSATMSRPRPNDGGSPRRSRRAIVSPRTPAPTYVRSTPGAIEKSVLLFPRVSNGRRRPWFPRPWLLTQKERKVAPYVAPYQAVLSPLINNQKQPNKYTTV
jgi:hypothetical protein